MKEMKKIEEEIVISIKTDVPGTIHITKKLLEKVVEKKIEFDIKVREGSVDIQFILGFLSGYSASLLGNITWDLAKSIWRRLRREIKLGREPLPATFGIKSKNLEEMITGHEDQDELRHKFRSLDSYQ